MARFVLSFSVDAAAFDPWENGSASFPDLVAEQLRRVASRLTDVDHDLADGGPVVDVNGNVIGSYVLRDDDGEET